MQVLFFQFYVTEISFAFKSYLQLVVDFIVKISEKQKKPFYPLDFDVSKLNRQGRNRFPEELMLA